MLFLVPDIGFVLFLVPDIGFVLVLLLSYNFVIVTEEHLKLKLDISLVVMSISLSQLCHRIKGKH